MKILFIHQNFPGQFKHVVPALVLRGHDVSALYIERPASPLMEGVHHYQYKPLRSSTPSIHPWLVDVETKTIRAEAAFQQLRTMKRAGYTPDLIIAHPGWGESLFVKQIWPHCKLAIYCEFFYNAENQDTGFDPEFPLDLEEQACRLMLKNSNNYLHFEIADAGISPTHWQQSTFPSHFRDKIRVIHDGIDTRLICPNPAAELTLNHHLRLTKNDEVITFVNRNLEPYRGYHIFMRALPHILRERPHARVVIVGGDQVSYGASAPSGHTWKEIYWDEVKSQLTPQMMQRIHFVGKIPYVHFISLLQISSLHIYLTYPFVLSWSLLEAMSAGCSILASDTQPLKEAIIDGQTGQLTDFFDAVALSQKAIQMLADHGLREKLGANARQFACEHYDLASVCLPQQLAWVEGI